MVKPLGCIGEHYTRWYVAGQTCRFKVNKEGLAGAPLNIESKSCGRGATQVHLNGGAAK